MRRTTRRLVLVACGLYLSGLSGGGMTAQAQSPPSTPPAEQSAEPQQQVDPSSSKPLIVRLMERLNNKLDRTQQELLRVDDESSHVSLVLQDEFEVPEGAFTQILTQLQLQRIQLSIELKGYEAKQRELERLSAADATAEPSPAAEFRQNALEKMRAVLAQENLNLEREEALFTRGVSPAAKVAEIKQRILQMELQMSELQTAIVRVPAPWIAEAAAKISLDRIETAAKLAEVEERLQALRGARSLTRQLQSLRVERESLHAELSVLRADIRFLREESLRKGVWPFDDFEF